LYTSKSQPFYARLGWDLLGTDNYEGALVTIMMRDLRMHRSGILSNDDRDLQSVVRWSRACCPV
jgi:hypothetical protein